MNYLRATGVKSFIVLRQRLGQEGKVAPLKACESRKACSVDSSKKELSLAQVSLHWKTGKGNCQTSKCKDAISACLLDGIPSGDIVRYVVKSMNKDDQAVERVRVRGCAYYLSRSLKIRPAGQAAPAAATTKLTDVEDLLSLGIPFQQNGVVFKRGDKTKKRKLLREAAEKLDGIDASEDVGTQVEMDQAKLRTGDREESGSIGSIERAFDTAIITPSNSMEEVDTTRSHD